MNPALLVCIKSVIIGGLLDVSSNINNSIIFYNGYALSNLHIAFIIILALLTSFKYNILKVKIESKDKNKFLKCAIIIIAMFTIINAIYFIIPKYYEINNWFLTNYESVDKSLIDLIFIPKYYKSLNIFKMTFLETIFSLVLVYIAYLRENKTNGYITYILEKILKKSFRYNVVIIFLIYIMTVPNKFLRVREIKYIGIGILFIFILVETIKIYLTVSDCKNKNKEKYGKENLIILMNHINFNFSLSDYIINPLRIFKRYDNKKIFKSLIVSGKKYTFVLYDAIRNGLVDIKQYENVAYLITINEDFFNNANKKKLFKDKIEDIASKEKFIIYEGGAFFLKPTVVEEFKSKYSYRVKEKIDLKDILDMVTLKPDADELKIKTNKLLRYIENKELNNYLTKQYKEGQINNNDIEHKKIEIQKLINKIPEDRNEEKKIEKKLKTIELERNRYLKYGLKLILNSFNYIEYFYTLLKMSEYVIHYMGLKYLLENNEMTPKKFEALTKSTWREFVKLDKKYSGESEEKIEGIVSAKEIRNSLIKLQKIVNSAEKKKDNNKTVPELYDFTKDVCKIVAEIRNKILVHGVVSHEIAEESINDLFNILFILVREFEELNITIEEDEKIKNILPKDMLAIYRYLNQQYLYSNPVVKNDKIIYNECMNYETGKKRVIDANPYIYINKIYSIKEIEDELKSKLKDRK